MSTQCSKTGFFTYQQEEKLFSISVRSCSKSLKLGIYVSGLLVSDNEIIGNLPVAFVIGHLLLVQNIKLSSQNFFGILLFLPFVH